MSRRVVLWIAFAVVHLGVAVLGFLLPNAPMGDVYLVYEPWTRTALTGGGIVGIDEDWVYPQLALIPMILASGLAWIAGYTVGWAILITILDAIAFAVLVGPGTSRGRVTAAWFWLAYLALLGPIAMYRIDAVTVPLAVAGCLWLVARPWLGAGLLVVATWIKVWPAALVAAAVVTLRRRMTVVSVALVVSAAVVLVVTVLGGSAHLFGFVGAQTGRGLQLEAPVTTAYVWMAMLGVPGASIYYDSALNTIQAVGPASDVVAEIMTPVLAIAVLGILAIGVVKVRRGASFHALFPALALALVVALIGLNKVGSPQFATWLIAPIVIALVLDRRRVGRVAVFALALAALTQLVYPILYGGLAALDPFAVAVITVRNVGTLVLLGWSVVRLARVPVRREWSVASPS